MHCSYIYFSFIIALADGFFIPDRLRFKRDSNSATAVSPPTRPRPYELPAGYRPYPGIDASENIGPTFPLAHTFTNGMEVNPGKTKYVDASLNVPIPGWGKWDLTGRQLWGPQTTWMNYGHLVQPANMFNLTPSEINDVMSSPGYQAAREKAKPQPVVQLPGGFVPANCTPPMCNPFIHQVASGVQFLPGQKNKQYDGLIDFPIPTGPNGQNVRFPLGGNFVAGKSPYMYSHGHVLNPVNPFPGYKPNGAAEGEGASLLERTNSQSSATSRDSVGDSAPADLPPLPPNYPSGRRKKRGNMVQIVHLGVLRYLKE